MNTYNYCLVYANGCNESNMIRQLIESNGLNEFIRYACVNDMNENDILALGISHVPSIAITMNGKQQWQIGSDNCARLLEGIIMNRRNVSMQMTESRMNAINQAQRATRIQNDGPSEFVEAEMEGFGDTYSYTKSNVAQPKQYISPNEQINIVTLQNDNEGVMNKRQLTQNIKNLERDRQNDIEQCKINMEREQLNSVIGNM